jgi:LuxR family maltose regulon positive regulatory protein
MTLLINDLALGDRQERVLLVLDDYHVIHNHDVHQAVAFLLNNGPGNIHLALTTRSDPPLPLAQLRVRRQMTEIRASDLRFSVEETAVFLSQALDASLPLAQIKVLTERTEGWAAAVQLAALALQGQSIDRQVAFVTAFSGGHAHVVDYLLDEVWLRQPEAVRSFWLVTSILDELSGPLCDALTGRGDSAQMLADLHRQNLFLTPLDHEHRWYRYHRLFADMLRARATELGATEIRRLHQRAAQWYADRENLPQAIRHALAAEDLVEATRLIGMAAEAALREGNMLAIQEWLAALPDAHVRAQHQLALAKGWFSYLNGRINMAVVYAAAARKTWPDTGVPASAVSLLGLETLIAILQGDHQTGIALAQEALALIEHEPHTLRGLLLMNLMQAQAAVGRISDAVETGFQGVAAGAEAGSREGSVFLKASLYDGLLQLLILQGELQHAISLGNEAISQFADKRGQPLPAAGSVCISLGQAHFEQGDVERARDLTQQGIALSETLGATMAVIGGQLRLAQIEALRGETKTALTLLTDVQTLREPPHFQLVASALAATLRLRQGDTATALAWAEQVALPNPDAPVPGFEMVYLAYVRCLLVAERWAEADGLLAKMASAAREQSRHGSLVSILVVQALSQQAQERREAALATLREAVGLAAAVGYQRPLLEDLPLLATLLPSVRDGADAFVASLLNGAGHSPAQTVLPEALNQRETQILRLINAGRSNPEIARELYLSVNTVKWYVKQVFQKLDVSSRNEATFRARELDLL